MISLNRRNLILLLALLLAAVLVIVIVVRYRSVTDVAEFVESLPSGVELALQDIDYMHSEQGIDRWRLEAKRAERLAEEGQLAVEKITLIFYDDQGAHQTVIRADEGDSDKAFAEIYLRGHVRIESARGYKLGAEQLVYRQADRLVVSDQPVTITMDELIVTGNGLILDLDAQKMTIFDQVEAVLPLTEAEKVR